MKFKKILLIPWLLCLPITIGISTIDNESNFKDNNTQMLEETNSYLNLDITYGNDAFHGKQPTITQIDVYYSGLNNVDQIELTGGIVISPLNPANPIQSDQLKVGEPLKIIIDKSESNWKSWFNSHNEYHYDSSGESTLSGKDYPPMFKITDEDEEDDYLKVTAIAPAVDLWYAPTIEVIQIITPTDPEQQLGEAVFKDIDAKGGVPIFWWVIIGLILVGLISFVGWEIYKKKNKYLI